MMGEQRSPVECSSEWVGCGISVQAHPARSSCAPSGERACRPLRKRFSFLFAKGGGRELTGILDLLKQRPHLLICEQIIVE